VAHWFHRKFATGTGRQCWTVSVTTRCSLTKIRSYGPESEPFSTRWAIWTKLSDNISKHFSQTISTGTAGPADPRCFAVTRSLQKHVVIVEQLTASQKQMALDIASMETGKEPTKDCALVPLHMPQALALKAQITRERLYRPELSSGMRRFDSSVTCRIWLETLSHLACASFEASLRIKAHAHMLRHACSVKLERTASTRGRCRRTSGTAISRTRRVTRRWRRTALKASGGTNWRMAFASIVSRSSVTISVGEQSAAAVRASQSRE